MIGLPIGALETFAEDGEGEIKERYVVFEYWSTAMIERATHTLSRGPS
jgi:hypothetical protein